MSKRIAAAGTLAGALPIVLGLLLPGTAAAHGSMGEPGSRVLNCYAEGPESPQSAACKAAVRASGTQAFYDWNGVRIGDAAGRHRQIIPDGKLCSAGNDQFKGLDLPRADWKASSLPAGGAHTLRYKVTAQHRGSFELYVTKDGYDPAKPLRWADLEAKPFATVKDPKVENGHYVLPANLPAKHGRHLIYAIWQRSDSPEAFYSCSDVDFGGNGSNAPAKPKPEPQPAESGHEHHAEPPAPPVSPAPPPPAPVPPAAEPPSDGGQVANAAHESEPAANPTVPLCAGAAVIAGALGTASFLRRRPAHAKRRGHPTGRHSLR